ncbi:MAG: MATE family efflux transporter [Cohaesibacter sp.]|nr:MATE family efflux transporter [Cohaesibacter sp.]
MSDPNRPKSKDNLAKGGRASSQAILVQAGYFALSGLLATSALLIDANMVAPLGDEVLAGLGLSAGLYGLFMALLFGLGSAAQILLSQSISSDARASFYRRLGYCLLIGLGLCLFLLILFRFNIHFLVDWLAITSGVGFAAKRYLSLLLYGLPISFAAYLLSISFDVRKQAGKELWGFAIEIPLNLALNAILIYGLFGVSARGIEGAAIATLCAQSARLVYLVWITKQDLFQNTQWTGLSLPSRQERQLFHKLMIPVAINVAALIAGSQAYNLLFAQLPYQQFAALALLAPWLSIANVLGRGLAMSATVSAAGLQPQSPALSKALSQILAAIRNFSPKLSLAFLLVSMLVCALSLHVSEAVRIHFLTLIPLAFVLVFIRTISVSLGAVLRVVDQPKWVLRVQLGLQWGLGLPLLLVLLFLFELSLLVAFGILVLEESLRLGLMIFRFKKHHKPL